MGANELLQSPMREIGSGAGASGRRRVLRDADRHRWIAAGNQVGA